MSGAPRRTDGSSGRRKIAFLLPGQGEQHPRMAAELYGTQPVFTATMDDFFHEFGVGGPQLRREWLSTELDASIDDGRLAQPLLFAVCHALGRTLVDRGVRPDALLGHSIGGLAAAALADVFSLACGARVMVELSAAVAELPRGGLLAVSATPTNLRHLLTDDVVVGAVNAPRQTVLAGPDPQLTSVELAIRAEGLSCRRVRARQPFHSPSAARVAGRIEETLGGVRLRPPRVPIQSTHTGQPVRMHEALTPSFWARQYAAPVLFWPALDDLLRGGDFVLIDIGPGQDLSALARRHPAVRSGRSTVVTMLPVNGLPGTAGTWRAALDGLASLAG